MEIYKRRPEDPAQIKSLEKDLQGLQRQAAGGADFGLLASQASEGPSRAKGGDLGWLDSVSDLNEPMAKALGDLKPGQVSNVVPAPDGFRIYKLVEVKEPQSGFEGARELVESSVMEQFRTAAFAEAEKSCDISLPHGKKSRTVASPVRPTRANRSEDDVRRVQADSSRSTGASNGGNRITVRKSGQNGALGKSNMLSAAKEPPAGSMAVIDMNSMRPVGRQSPGDITTQATGSTADSVVAGPAGFGGSGFRPTSQATNGQMVASQESASKSRNPISNFISGFRKPATPQR